MTIFDWSCGGHFGVWLQTFNICAIMHKQKCAIMQRLPHTYEFPWTATQIILEGHPLFHLSHFGLGGVCCDKITFYIIHALYTWLWYLHLKFNLLYNTRYFHCNFVPSTELALRWGKVSSLPRGPGMKRALSCNNRGF